MKDDEKDERRPILRKTAGLLPGLFVAGALSVPTTVDAASLKELVAQAELSQERQVQVLDSQLSHAPREAPSARPIWGKGWTRYDWLKVCPC